MDLLPRFQQGHAHDVSPARWTYKISRLPRETRSEFDLTGCRHARLLSCDHYRTGTLASTLAWKASRQMMPFVSLTTTRATSVTFRCFCIFTGSETTAETLSTPKPISSLPTFCTLVGKT